MPFVVTSCAFKIHRPSGGSRGKPVLICILVCSLTYENRLYKNGASVVMNPLVSLFCCLVARSRRKRGNRQTDRWTDRQTHLQTKYHNPRCACTPRVNEKH